MHRNAKHLTALGLSLLMAASCFGGSVFAEEAAVEISANDIRGTAFTENFSTLKEHTDSALTVPGDPVTYTGSAVIRASGGKLDATGAVITVAPGDGYYPDDLIFNGSAAENITVNADGTLSFTMHTGDLTWNNRGFPVEEGGMEFSAQGGDLNGQYHIRLAVNGLTADGKAIGEVIVPVYIYIYGREFSDMASPQNPGSSYWGVGILGEAVLPYAAQAENPEPQAVSGEPVWNWTIRNAGEAEGYSVTDTAGEPVLCDKATDDFYVTWPAGVDASAVSADDVTITLTSAYGESRVLKAGGDQKTAITGHNESEKREIPAGEYAVFSTAGETQISVNFVHWLTYPVYTTMTIDIQAEGAKASKTYDVDSVYIYSTQTGGGLDLADTTVTVVSYYGIENIDELDVGDFYKNGGMYSYWAYSEGGGQQGGGQQGGGQQGGGGMPAQGPQGDLFLVMNADGTVNYVTGDKSDPAIIMAPVKPAGWRGHSYFYTNYSTNETMEVEYEGKILTFTRQQPRMLGQLDAPSANIVPLPGYIQTIGGHYSDHMNAGWAFFMRDRENDVGWTVTDQKLPFTDVGLYSSHCYNSVAWAYGKGIINGVTDTTFEPETTLTRAMAVTMLWRAQGKPSVSGAEENPFADVAAGEWYYDAVLWAVANGITDGTSDTTFSPNSVLTHEQAAAFLYRCANGLEADPADVAAWAAAGAIADLSNDPQGDCTRFQAVSYLYRAMGE